MLVCAGLGAGNAEGLQNRQKIWRYFQVFRVQFRKFDVSRYSTLMMDVDTYVNWHNCRTTSPPIGASMVSPQFLRMRASKF